MQTDAEIELGDRDNEAEYWLLHSNQKMMALQHSTENFNQCWRSTRAKLVRFLNKYRKRSVDLYPRQLFVREQALLLARGYIDEMDNRKFTAVRFREGVENLYYLLETVQAEDEPARNTLSFDLSEIVLACGDLVEYYEISERLSVTDWNQVSMLFKNRITTNNYRLRFGGLHDFELGTMIGAGGFGAVYRAKLGEIPCVLKFVPPNVLPSTDQAIVDKMVACMINHPCLVVYYAAFMNQDAFITCMELIAGVPLIRIVHKLHHGLPFKFVKIVIGQLGLAVQHLHFKGFIHRDVKPENVMALPGGRIKLIDFDTCKVSSGKYCTSRMTAFREKTAEEFHGAELAGTVPYMAPEALMKTGLGRAVDWWSVGVTTYHIATGHLPFEGYTIEEVQPQTIGPSYSWPHTRNWSAPLQQFVADCMDPNPHTRLCSEHYSDFETHQYFNGTDFHWLETESNLVDFPLISALMRRDPATDAKHLSAGAHARRNRLFPVMTFLESANPKNCFYYSSPGFVECLRCIDRGHSPTLEDIARPQESIHVFDDESGPYLFENFLRNLDDEQQEPYEEHHNHPGYHTDRTGTFNFTWFNSRTSTVHRTVSKHWKRHR